MRNGRFSRIATCPFYQSVIISKGGQIIGICCEGLDDNLGFEVQSFIRFKSKKDMQDYFELFCADINNACPYWKAIDRKYQ